MAENPFIFGKIVKGEHFCDREEETGQILKITSSKQHLAIISPRRYGKTSLIVNALEKSKIPYLYLDCSFIEDEQGLISTMIKEYASKLDSTAMLEKLAKKFEISLAIELNPISINVKQIGETSLKSILFEISKNYVIVFDEFQDLYEKNGLLVNKLRSIIQFLGKSAVMLGSKRHMLNSMFLKPRGIFYNFGQVLHLEKIKKEEFVKFISKWFSKYNVKLEQEEISELLEITGNHPFFTQYFCYFLFEAKTASKKATVKDTLQKILSMNSSFYEETYSSLTSSQRNALFLLSSDKKELYSKQALEEFKIKSSQALQKALNSLMKKEIIDKNGSYFILDVFFRHWLYQKVLNQKV